MPKKPNIVLITSDQQRADCYGFAGRKVQTPHLDRMAAAGIRLPNCITPCLICQPARASLLTGMLPLTHGVCDNGIDLAPALGEQGFAGRLAQAGYRTALVGKAHFSTKATFAPTGTPECMTSSADYGPDWFGPYMGFEHVELAVFGHNNRIRPLLFPPHGQHYERWFSSRGGGEAPEIWARSLPPEPSAAQTWNSALPVAWHPTSWTTDRAIEHLRRHDPDEPLCLWVSYGDPHHPFDCPAPWSRLHDPDEVDLPAHRTKDLERRPWWHEAALEGTPALADPNMQRFRKEGSRVPDQTDRQLAEMTSNYYGMISLIDDGVGRITAVLEELGMSEDTIVIYTSDHGDMMGDHGLYLKHPMAYEGVLRVGMIATGPGVQAGGVVDDPVSLLDLAATFCELGDTSLPEEAQSRSLWPLITGTGGGREVAYSEWNVHAARCGVPLQLRIVRTRRHKCTFELTSGAGELYDLENDPDELTNLFDDPGHAAVRAELEALMRARPGGVMDPLPEPVGMS